MLLEKIVDTPCVISINSLLLLYASTEYGNKIIIEDASDGLDISVYVEPVEELFIDLRLPSGTLWGKYNIGANSITDFGNYFAWADTSAIDFNQTLKNMTNDVESYIYYDDENYQMSKYNEEDELTVLDASDDIATIIYGEEYSLPTNIQIQELIDNTTQVVYSDNENMEDFPHVYGVEETEPIYKNGIKFIGTNGNSIFIPFSGYSEVTFLGINQYHKNKSYNSKAALWSNTISNNKYLPDYMAYALKLDDSTEPHVSSTYMDRYEYLCARAVKNYFI